jgi:hypothetical protein
MKVGRWVSVLAFLSVGCLATPAHDPPKEGNQGQEPSAGSAGQDEPELSFVAGLTCATNEDCGRRSYCQYPERCAATGSCQTRPKVCTRIHAPVCGCDGQTYANACLASSAGASVRHEGECNAGEACGPVICESGLECCNASCGTCVTPGGVCTKEACE